MPKAGAGLGLAICRSVIICRSIIEICRSVIEQHRGRISVESAVGAGTTFCCRSTQPGRFARPGIT